MKKLLLLISLFLVTATTASAAFWIIPQAGRKVTINSAGVAKDKLTNGLVGWWTFDGGDRTATVIFDKSGNGKNGTVTGTSKISGKIGQGIYFPKNGVSNIVNVGNNFAPTRDNSWTYAMWFKNDSKVAGAYYLLGKYSSSYTTNAMLMGDGGTGMYCNPRVGGVQVSAAGTNKFQDGKWHHITCLKTNTSTTLYIDGRFVVKTDGDLDNDYGDGGVDMYFGDYRAVNPPNEPWKGAIDDVRIYSRELSANEIYSLYQYGNAKINVASQAVADQGTKSGLVGHWTFNGGDCGATWCVDKSGSGNTGTLTGTKKVGGKIGQGLDFNGTSDYAQQGSNISFGDTVSIAAWIKPDTLGRSNNIYNICDDANSACTGGDYATLGLAILSDNTLGVNIAYSNATSRRLYMKSNSANLFRAGKWTHVAVSYTYSTNDLSLFVDGIRVALKPEGANCWTTGWVCVVGTGGETAFAARPAIGALYNKYAGTFSSNFDGKIDDVRIYSRALSANEIYSLYMYGK